MNHCISKSLVQKALVLQKALSLEDLSGIRERSNSLNKTMRWLMGNWAFADLAAKIVYKAAEVGLPVVLVDPKVFHSRHTSRTCSECGYCEKANRKNQASFACLSCGFCANADVNASCNIARLGMEARAKLSDSLMFRSLPAFIA